MRYWSGEIGGIPLEDGGEPCAFQLLGSDAFEKPYVTQSIPGADGFKHYQDLALPYGQTLELNFEHIPKTLLRSLLDLLAADLPGRAGFACEFSDGFQTITGTFTPSGDYYTRGEPDTNYVTNAILRIDKKGE